MDLGASISVSGLSSWVYDATRDVIHVITTDGKLMDWSLSSRSFTTTINVGGSPSSIDVTPDGAYALIGNKSLVTVNGVQMDDITRVNLSTHAIDHLQFAAGGYEGGVAHVAVGADGKALVTTTFNGSGWTSFRTFQASAANPVFSPVTGLIETHGSGAEAAYLLVSENRQHILVQDANISNGPLYVYSASTDFITYQNDLYNLHTSGFNAGTGSYNEARGLVLDVVYRNVFVLSDKLQLVKDLSSLQNSGTILNGTFDVDGAHVFLWEGQAHDVLVLDTTSWKQVGSLAVQSGGPGYIGAVSQMGVISDGKMLALTSAGGLELVDLAANLKLTITGDATNETLYGAIGADTIAGGAGADTLVAGAGNDVLVGGAGSDHLAGGGGADIFRFDVGDSGVVPGQLDQVLDWESGDQLAFARGATSSNYLELTASTYDAALSLANGAIGSGAADYVAVQIGRDTVVFADTADNNGVAEDAIVLVNRTLADIAYSDIVAGVPAAALTLYGGNGDDTLVGGALGDQLWAGSGHDSLSGGGGDDFLWGELDADTISGGDGNDQIVGDGLLSGDAGDDNLSANHGDDTIVGGAGNDALRAEIGVNRLTGGDGNDFLSVDNHFNAVLGHDTLEGGDGNDEFRIDGGAAGVDVMVTGGAGDDTLIQISTVSGQVDLGDGDDTLTIFGPVGLTATLGAGADTVTIILGYASSVGGLTVSDFDPGHDRLVSPDLDSALTHWNGENPFGTGHLQLAASGMDTLLQLDRDGGGDGYHTLIKFIGLSPADLSGVTFFGYKPDGSAPMGDTISGTAGNDGALHGGIGADSLSGLGGDDIISGGPGDDTIDGGVGADILYGGGGSDLVHGGDGNDVLTGSDSDHLLGDAGEDTLAAVSYAGVIDAPTIEGGLGNDCLQVLLDPGASGTVTVHGDEGDDVLIVAQGNVVATLGAGVDTVTLDASDLHNSHIVITDFQTGVGGDVLNIADYVSAAYPGWDGSTNPFALGLVRLAASGGDTIVQFADGGWRDRIVLQNVPLASVSAANLSGYPADGSTPPGLTIAGSSAADTLQGSNGPDALSGGGGADSLSGGRYADTLSGQDGDDTLDGGTGGDVLSGGVGNDWILGGSGDNTIGGDSGADSLFGGSGADNLTGGEGNDVLFGSFGQDTLVGGAGTDTLVGGADSDVFSFAAGDSGVNYVALDQIQVWDIGDHLMFPTGAASGAEYREATSANYAAAKSLADAAIAGGQVNYVAVSVGPDLFVFADSRNDNGGADDAVFLPGRGLADIDASNFIAPAASPPLSTSTADQVLRGADGDDALFGGAGADSLFGAAGNDQLQGLTGNDTIDGGSGDDYIQGGPGDDHLSGGEGVDTLSYLNAQAAVAVSLALTGSEAVGGGDGVDTADGFENLDGSLFGDRLTGDARANLLRGWGGDDTLSGAAGADTLDGRDGADSLFGGDGNDSIMGGSGHDVVSMGAGSDSFWVGPGDSGLNPDYVDTVTDWSSEDHLQFGYFTGTYTETSAATYEAALAQANSLIAGGYRYVATQVGSDVIVFADSAGDGGMAEDAVRLSGRSLADISAANLGSYSQPAASPTPPPPPDPDPPSPPPPPPPSGGGGGGGGGDPNQFRTPDEVGSNGADVRNLGDGDQAYSGGGGDDSIMGGAGNDLIYGGDGADTVMAGSDNDTVVGGAGVSYLRGEEGDDRILGGADFDDINGNQGQDTINGGDGDDWVVGGKDNDIIFGESGGDLVYGNLGADTLGGGVGNDVVRGGQGNDMVRGDEGDDFVSGDRGSDTMTGGLGADVFHTFGDAGMDVVTDFNAAEGDRVMLDPGTVYTVSQVGDDTVIDMQGGGQMILTLVRLSALPTGWIFGA